MLTISIKDAMQSNSNCKKLIALTLNNLSQVVLNKVTCLKTNGNIKRGEIKNSALNIIYNKAIKQIISI